MTGRRINYWVGLLKAGDIRASFVELIFDDLFAAWKLDHKMNLLEKDCQDFIENTRKDLYLFQ